MEEPILKDDRQTQYQMEDMIVHESIFEVCRVLGKSDEEDAIESDYLYNILHLILTPKYSFKEKVRRLKGKLSRGHRGETA